MSNSIRFAIFVPRLISKIVICCGLIIICIGAPTALIKEMGSKFALATMIFGIIVALIGWFFPSFIKLVKRYNRQ
jgi:hypothetical protein